VDAGSDGGGGTGGAAASCAGFASKALSALTPSEMELLCDCAAQILGGYGNTIVCEASTTIVYGSQQQCLDAIDEQLCSITASDALSCASDTAACNAESPTCQAFIPCL
jgi:hypothetical protein